VTGVGAMHSVRPEPVEGRTGNQLTGILLSQRLGTRSVEELAKQDVQWDPVLEVTAKGISPVYDLVMPGTHNFIANGLAVHNSGELEQVADLVLFIYREDYYNPNTEKKNLAEILIAKHRNGPIGQVDLFFHREHSKFGNLERRRT